MANILDYLDWRGDLTLKQAPFNEVDNLILAELSFLDFRGIVPGPGKGAGIVLREAAEQFFARLPVGESVDMGLLVPNEIPSMLKKLSASRRFGGMRLSCFVDALDMEKAEQFSALSIETGDGLLYVSFRGTDDTLAGWLEDFNMTCLPEIPAQKKAVEYVKAVARQFPRRRLRLGGHSKGGNLAVYAGVFSPAPVQRRIETVWSNDGPGFRDGLLDLPQHRRIADRIFSIVPKSSIIGMLLEHEEDYTVVESNQLGFLQHDGFSWQVLGDHFITLRQVTRQAQLSDLALRNWVRSLSLEERKKFVEALFSVLSASGAQTLTDLKTDGFKAASAIIRAMKDLDKETRDALLHFAGILFKSGLLLTLEGLQDR